jgi:hypothetical protein
MIKKSVTGVIILVLFLGCDKSASSDLPESMDVNQFDASPEVKRVLTEIKESIDRYNRVARGIELSEHGVKGHLSDATAAKMAQNANRLISDINSHFTTPVCKYIGATWYQVPSRFCLNVQENASTRKRDAPCFTISHHNCGLYEYDFVINNNGFAEVVAERYDDLDIQW